MFEFLTGRKTKPVDPADALPGRSAPMPVTEAHRVLGHPLTPPFPEGCQRAIFGMGCFWGAERLFWRLPGVWTTAVGYAGGHTPNPTYEETCTARTGHAEVVLVVYDPTQVSYEALLATFWEEHDPTQGMRQGNDVGTQYRSLVGTTTPAQAEAARRSLATYQERLTAAGRGDITTEVVDNPTFYYAETYHQQYLDRVPNGYCGLQGTGVSCPIGTGVSST